MGAKAVSRAIRPERSTFAPSARCGWDRSLLINFDFEDVTVKPQCGGEYHQPVDPVWEFSKGMSRQAMSTMEWGDCARAGPEPALVRGANR